MAALRAEAHPWRLKSFPPGGLTVHFDLADGGVEKLPVEFRKVGVRNLEVTPQGTVSVAVNPGKIETTVIADDPVRVQVDSFPSPVIAGESHQFFVTAFDEFDNVADKYRGTVAFTVPHSAPWRLQPSPDRDPATARCQAAQSHQA